MKNRGSFKFAKAVESCQQITDPCAASTTTKTTTKAMPLVTLYVNQAVLEICGKPQLAAFHDFLAQKDMFATTPGILQVNLVQTANMHPNPNGVFVSIRCKGTKERTKEKLSSILQRAGEHLVKALGRDCKLRLECFEPDLQLAVKVAAKQEQAKL